MKKVSFSLQQVEKYKKQLHDTIHWLLIYKEKRYSGLDDYFSSVLFRINGLNSMLDYPEEMVELVTLLEAARMESHKDTCKHKVYRKAILDAHAVVDRIPFDKLINRQDY